MATHKGLPRGFVKNVLVMDCETTGLFFSGPDPSYNPNTDKHHQAVSWGMIVADATTLKPLEELYVEIKWNEDSKINKAEDHTWGAGAEKVHGLSFDHLEANGLDEIDAVTEIVNLILKYWGPKNAVHTTGHNVHLFDLAFLRSLLNKYELPVRFGNRHFDSNSIGFGTVGAYNSDDLFSTVGFDARDAHNSLEDARMSLESFRIIKLLWESKVGLNAYE